MLHFLMVLGFLSHLGLDSRVDRFRDCQAFFQWSCPVVAYGVFKLAGFIVRFSPIVMQDIR